MSIDHSGEFWIGSEPADILDFLAAYSADGYQVTHARAAKCACGSDGFQLVFLPLNGIGRATCVACQDIKQIADAAALWDEAAEEEELEQAICPGCGSDACNLALGIAGLHDKPDQARWLYMGWRCIGCGILGSPYDTKMDGEQIEEMLKMMGPQA